MCLEPGKGFDAFKPKKVLFWSLWCAFRVNTWNPFMAHKNIFGWTFWDAYHCMLSSQHTYPPFLKIYHLFLIKRAIVGGTHTHMYIQAGEEWSRVGELYTGSMSPERTAQILIIALCCPFWWGVFVVNAVCVWSVVMAVLYDNTPPPPPYTQFF